MAAEDPENPERKPQPEPGKSGSDDDGSPEASLRGLANAFKLFLFPFLFSWALAYVGSARGTEWLYFAGLGGVTLSLVVLMIWLIS